MPNVKMLKVRAADSSKPVHRENGVREVDSQGNDLLTIKDQPVEVPDTHYYRKRLRLGDLVEVKEE